MSGINSIYIRWDIFYQFLDLLYHYHIFPHKNLLYFQLLLKEDLEFSELFLVDYTKRLSFKLNLVLLYVSYHRTQHYSVYQILFLFHYFSKI